MTRVLVDDQAQPPDSDDSKKANPAESNPTGFEPDFRMQLEALAESPGDTEVFLDLLARHLLTEPTPDTFGRFLDAAAMFLDSDGFWPIISLAREDPETRASAIADSGFSPAAELLVRRTIGLYGEELAYAWDMWRFSARAEDWKRLRTDFFLDVQRNSHVVHLDIEKNNRETLSLRGEADSMLRLVRSLLRELTDGAEGQFDVFGSGAVAEFREAVEEFENVLGSTAKTDDAEPAAERRE